jgi:response regulator RpfG family c-di-GMP phosphodiesterase
MAATESELRVVITDDSINDHFFIKKALADHHGNLQITSLYDGEELINFLLKKNKYKDSNHKMPHIILVDVNMPRLSGFETLQQLDQYTELKDIFFVIFSSYYDNQTFQSKNLKVEFYNKPMSLQGYREVLEKIIDASGKEK